MAVSPTAARILRVFLEDPEQPRYGFEIMEAASVKSGTLYPILNGFHQAGWMTREKENVDPSVAGRPARRYYRLTGEGARAARLELAEFAAQVGLPVDSYGWLPGSSALGGGRV